ncbi:uncharacterized protein TRAVEDRAFT_60683 [Trametes versicolor FP-101664 SS1]|uniref:uncharacterized protein n=1 Tax=Trametes versicolor (strain FP-101664) TaxID=717944 RepID=UPI0004624675|nr:uncharacterized protein TRAVEDRAFT_60683 [Trametes versicolor FP-101664 SS1]EIW54445.1 hypothetical protein TRAVEDRAFT_60683 [Trametes versicolor FP-101664 SS1]
MDDRVQLVQSHGFFDMWDAPWAALVAMLWFVLVGFVFLGLVWMVTWFFGERAPPRKTIMEHVDAYAATLRGLPASSSPRLRMV